MAALDGSDRRTQQLETPEVGRAGGAVSSEMSFFVGFLFIPPLWKKAVSGF